MSRNEYMFQLNILIGWLFWITDVEWRHYNMADALCHANYLPTRAIMFLCAGSALIHHNSWSVICYPYIIAFLICIFHILASIINCNNFCVVVYCRYHQGFDKQPSVFAGINCATLMVIAGKRFATSSTLQRLGEYLGHIFQCCIW